MPTGARRTLFVSDARDLLRQRGLRWTPQRRVLLEVLAGADGHITGTELVDGCRAVDPSTTPSTVYRTLDVLEDLGLVRHSHGADGREEFHVLPAAEHGHIHCASCGRTWEISEGEAAEIIALLERDRGFALELSHLTVVGRCDTCRAEAPT